MQCSVCKYENNAADRYCAECGTPLAEQCRGCGVELESGAKFCTKCGTTTSPSEHVESGERPTSRNIADYTPRYLADKILQSRSAIEGERMQVTVLIAEQTSNDRVRFSDYPITISDDLQGHDLEFLVFDEERVIGFRDDEERVIGLERCCDSLRQHFRVFEQTLTRHRDDNRRDFGIVPHWFLSDPGVFEIRVLAETID